MSQTDPIGDMLAMIKNAVQRRKEKISLPHSRMKEAVARVLSDEGYVGDVRVTDPEEGSVIKHLHVYFRYDEEMSPVFRALRRVSRPGKRVYRGVGDLGRVLDGLGVSVLSTSKGVMSDRKARTERVGGEVICKVW